jgi:hypothetical protein
VGNPEADPISSIRAVRPVVASDSLRRLIRSAKVLFEEEGLDQVDGGVDPLVFDANGLHSTLYVRRAPATPKNDERLGRIEDYIRSPVHLIPRQTRPRRGAAKETTYVSRKNTLLPALKELEDLYVPDKSQLYLRASTLVCSSMVEVGQGLTEISLLADNGPVVDLLDAQSSIINEAASGLNANKLLPKKDRADKPRELPFMRARFTDQNTVDEFMEVLQADLPVVEVGLRNISYRHDLNG